MTEKGKRYLAWFVGILIVLFFLYLDEKPFEGADSILESDIDDTFVYEAFYSLYDSMDARHSTAKGFANISWWVVFVAGVFMAWKLRHKTLNFLEKIHGFFKNIFSRINDKV